MLSKNERICPCCGKQLNLIAPNKELLPNRFGISKNGIPFYLISGIRYFPYTISPESVSEFNSSILYKCGNIGEDWLRDLYCSDFPDISLFEFYKTKDLDIKFSDI